jgi:hypothetical protein
VISGRAPVVLFASSVALSAALLFSVEPLVAKMVTPLLGGAPAVWITCLLFFQTVLLAGYAYAHASTTWLRPRAQLVLHVVVLAAPLFARSIHVDESNLSSPSAGSAPAAEVLRLVAASVGLRFFALSTTAPVLSRWFSLGAGEGRSGKDPYFLYAASNLGSAVALAAYPLAIDTTVGLRLQSAAWRVAYGAFFFSALACALVTWRGASGAAHAVTRARNASDTGDERDASDGSPITWRRRLLWIGLAFAPSSALMGVTQFLTNDIAPVPLLWALPLFVFLATFVLAFAKTPVLSAERASRIFPFAVTACAIAIVIELNRPAPLVVALHLVTFFLGAMVCHGQLAADRPAPRRLTEFYLCLSIGGVLGALFNAILAPVIFNRLYEYPLALVLMALARPRKDEDGRRARILDVAMPLVVAALTGALLFTYRRVGLSPTELVVLILVPAFVNYRGVGRPWRFALGLAAFMAARAVDEREAGRVLVAERNFFGVVRVTSDPAGRFVQMLHGNTIHGTQSTRPEERQEPLAYFHRTGPLGEIFDAFEAQAMAREVAVVGLGAGTVACYARPDERWTYYEIDPAVVRIARDPAYFTFLTDAFPDPSRLRVLLGDGRLMIAQAQPAEYGLIVLDAFSGDAIPIHLLTLEAMKIYASKLATSGLLVFHISNRYFDLRPELAVLARESGFVALGKEDVQSVPKELIESGHVRSRWVAMARSDRDLARLSAGGWSELPPRNGPAWTDDRSNVLRAFAR